MHIADQCGQVSVILCEIRNSRNSWSENKNLKYLRLSLRDFLRPLKLPRRPQRQPRMLAQWMEMNFGKTLLRQSHVIGRGAKVGQCVGRI